MQKKIRTAIYCSLKKFALQGQESLKNKYKYECIYHAAFI